MNKSSKADVAFRRQETQYSCCAASIAAALKAHGKDVTEAGLNKVLGASPMGGATWEAMLATVQYFGLRGTLVVPSTIAQLKTWTDAGIPVIIAWNPEGRPWSHASCVFDVDDDHTVHIMDPNIPDPNETVRVVSKADFYGKWGEAIGDNLIVRRPAMAIEREITVDGRQVQAGKKELRSMKDRDMSRFLRNGPVRPTDKSDDTHAMDKAQWEIRKDMGMAGLPGAGMGAGPHKDKSRYDRKREKNFDREGALSQPLMTRRDYGVTAMLNTSNFQRILKMAEGLPGPVVDYVQEVQDANPDYSESQAWATAWSIYCKYKNPGSDHCKKSPSEYFKAAALMIAAETRVPVKLLTPALKAALKALRYSKRDISVQVSPTYSMYWPGDDGSRGFFQLVGVSPTPVIRGAFGGGALGAKVQSPVDSDQSLKPLPPGSVALKGQEGSVVYATLTAASMDDVLGTPGKVAGMSKQAGYTHYWEIKEPPTPEEWASLMAATRKILAAAKQAGIVVRGGMGTGAPEVKADGIWLNGDSKTGMDYETFNLEPVEGGNFCKTNQKPYDAVVVSILAVAKQILGKKIAVRSDGGASAIRKVLGTELTAKFEKGVSMTVDEVAEVVGPEFKEMNVNPPPSVIKVMEGMQGKTAGDTKALEKAIKASEKMLADLKAMKLPEEIEAPLREAIEKNIKGYRSDVGKTASAKWTTHLKDPKKPGFNLCGEKSYPETMADSPRETTCFYCRQAWEKAHGGFITASEHLSIDMFADILKDSKFEKGKSVPVSELPEELQDNVTDPPPAVRKLTEELNGKQAGGVLAMDMFAEALKEGKFEEGVPADPTENMSEEDAAEWHRQNDEHKDNFKGASTPTQRADEENDAVVENFFHKSAATGLYGFNKVTEGACGAGVNKLQKAAKKIASALYAKDESSPSFLNKHAARGGSKTASMLLKAMESIGPMAQINKTAGRSGTGLYGFSEKTAKLGLSACNDLHHEAGVIAGDLFARKGADPVKVSSYLASHAKKAKCPYAALLGECAPDAPVIAKKTATDFLASDEEDEVGGSEEVLDIVSKC